MGDEIALPAGTHRLIARVRLRSIVPVERLDIVSNGAVMASVPLTHSGTRADAEITSPVTRSAWFTLRAMSSVGAEPILDIYPFATTSPVYVIVGGRPIRNPDDARYFQRWIERVEEAAAAHPGWNEEREKAEVLSRVAEAKAIFRRRAEEAPP